MKLVLETNTPCQYCSKNSVVFVIRSLFGLSLDISCLCEKHRLLYNKGMLKL